MNTTSLNPSQITDNQVRKLGVMFEDAVRKVAPLSMEAQDLIENEWDEVKKKCLPALTSALQTIIDRKRNCITVRFVVKRGKTPQQLMDDTGSRKFYIEKGVAKNIPLKGGEGEEEVEFVFFPAGCRLSDEQVEVELVKRGLVQDLQAQFQYNAQNPEFADQHPNGASWKDTTGARWCYAAFYKVDGASEVSVSFSDADWSPLYWFGGRKV